MIDIHSCGYYCDKPFCIKAQRDELRDKLFAKEWQGLTNKEKIEITKNLPLHHTLKDIACAIEAKLKEKNT